MATYEAVAHRLGFPVTRSFAKKIAIVGAMVANRWSTDYLGRLVEVEPEDEFVPGGYL